MPKPHDYTVEVIVRGKEVLRGSFTLRSGGTGDTYTHMVELFRGSAPFDADDGKVAVAAMEALTKLMMRMGVWEEIKRSEPE